MTAHHFVGEGGYSEGLLAAGGAEGLLAKVSALVDAVGLQVIGRAGGAVPRRRRHPGFGVLAESHLVLHLWPEEDHVTIDLHICDYRTENEARARRLRDALDRFCFAPGSSGWTELMVGGRQLVSA